MGNFWKILFHNSDLLLIVLQKYFNMKLYLVSDWQSTTTTGYNSGKLPAVFILINTVAVVVVVVEGGGTDSQLKCWQNIARHQDLLCCQLA